ncbi:MAG: DUF3276 family protein [Bacteroidaceae bacterium]|nr:DUF3276 family protein [Bacteroidaceae bacterium]
METSDKKREEADRDVEFSYAIKAGKRIYYMDVRKTRKDDLYLSITESKKILPPDGDMTQASFEKHKIFLYKEDFSKFIDGLSKAISYIHEHQNPIMPDPESNVTASGTTISGEMPDAGMERLDAGFEIEF